MGVSLRGGRRCRGQASCRGHIPVCEGARSGGICLGSQGARKPGFGAEFVWGEESIRRHDSSAARMSGTCRHFYLKEMSGGGGGPFFQRNITFVSQTGPVKLFLPRGPDCNIRCLRSRFFTRLLGIDWVLQLIQVENPLLFLFVSGTKKERGRFCLQREQSSIWIPFLLAKTRVFRKVARRWWRFKTLRQS